MPELKQRNGRDYVLIGVVLSIFLGIFALVWFAPGKTGCFNDQNILVSSLPSCRGTAESME